jgi:2-oxoglutarate dehydrogenase E1 component
MGVPDNSLSSHNREYIEDLYESWKKDPSSVSLQWQELFSEYEKGPPKGEERFERIPAPVQPQDKVKKQGRVDSLVWAYRDVGYLYARLNPLVGNLTTDLTFLYKQEEDIYESLTLKEFGLNETDLDTEFSAGRYLKPGRAPLRAILEALRETYCSSMGIEFLHIQNKKIRRWLIERMESNRNKPDIDPSMKKIILQDLTKAEEFESFLHSQFIGQKRFSLEGAEVLIPTLHYLVNSAVETGVEDIVLGMSHRGRLNVLSNILLKPAIEIFSEFEDDYSADLYGGGGDVKYHLGYRMDHVHSDGKRVCINMVSNPSHLESVDPVVEGFTRALQEHGEDYLRNKVIPILIHGDAAFSAQGVVSETLNLSQLNGYKTGGTIHIIVNNQIGFTTSTRDARSTFFCTDIAKMMPIPILHVNGDDPEAVVHAADLALKFRQNFKSDVVIDIFCYRRHGHNEGDEPSFTHPKMYQLIRYHTSMVKRYAEKLVESGVVSASEIDDYRSAYRRSLKEVLDFRRKSHHRAEHTEEKKDHIAAPVTKGDAVTAVPFDILKKIAGKTTSIPRDFHVHTKLERIVSTRRKRFEEGKAIDFPFAETLAFGSLLLEGTPVRLSGEDSARGTFSQRHNVWWDTESTSPFSYVPLNSLKKGQAMFSVWDSPLSEFSVLGFEYGYSIGRNDSLVMWEAQFGDFSNGAQVIIDNYIATGEAKWRNRSGLVLLLPHGYEGMGPDHSSAHLERFLQLCADNNLQVCNTTTPAQYFHLLRKQVKQELMKPLIIMTTKSLLRDPAAVSPLEAFSEGAFSRVLDDSDPPDDVSAVFICSGKVYYDIVKLRNKREMQNAAFVRLEQLYPFPGNELQTILKRYKNLRDIHWVQEEPANRGAWNFIHEQISRGFDRWSIKYIGRKESASSATGSHRKHKIEQQELQDSVYRAAKGGAIAGRTEVTGRVKVKKT